jgi:hypothetical protein
VAPRALNRLVREEGCYATNGPAVILRGELKGLYRGDIQPLDLILNHSMDILEGIQLIKQRVNNTVLGGTLQTRYSLFSSPEISTPSRLDLRLLRQSLVPPIVGSNSIINIRNAAQGKMDQHRGVVFNVCISCVALGGLPRSLN